MIQNTNRKIVRVADPVGVNPDPNPQGTPDPHSDQDPTLEKQPGIGSELIKFTVNLCLT